jgi:hypothetical protein
MHQARTSGRQNATAPALAMVLLWQLGAHLAWCHSCSLVAPGGVQDGVGGRLDRPAGGRARGVAGSGRSVQNATPSRAQPGQGAQSNPAIQVQPQAGFAPSPACHCTCPPSTHRPEPGAKHAAHERRHLPECRWLTLGDKKEDVAPNPPQTLLYSQPGITSSKLQSPLLVGPAAGLAHVALPDAPRPLESLGAKIVWGGLRRS